MKLFLFAFVEKTNNSTKLKSMKKLLFQVLLIPFAGVSIWAQGLSQSNSTVLPSYTNRGYADDNLWHMHNARFFQENFNFEGALLSLDNAVAQNPQSADALIARAIFRRKIGRDKEAQVDYLKAYSLNPYAADLYGYNGPYGLLKVISNEPNRAFQQLSLPRKVNYYYSALDQKLVTNSIGSEEATLLEEAVFYIEEKNYEAALDILEALTGSYPNSALSYDLKGMLLAHEGRYEEALLALKKAVELEPVFAIAWYNLGRVEKTMGHLDVAEKYFEKALLLQNDLTKVRFDKALLLKSAGKPAAAIKEYDEIIAMRGGDYLEAYLNRGLTRKMTGDFMGALEDLNIVLENDPANPEAFTNRGNLYLLYGYNRLAILDYTEAIRLNPDYAEAYFNRGLAQFLIYDKASGCFDLEKAVDLGFQRAAEKRKYFCVE